MWNTTLKSISNLKNLNWGKLRKDQRVEKTNISIREITYTNTVEQKKKESNIHFKRRNRN